MKTNKSYGCKDADMILAAEFIAKNLKAKLNVLGGICKYWTEPYSDDLIARVEFAIIYYLNNDSQKNLRNATTKLKSIMNVAIKNLAFFKTQLNIDFKNDNETRNEILETLGFNKYYQKASLRNQNVLLILLQTFKTNLTAEIHQQLISKSFSDQEIDELTFLANEFKNVNIVQENAKASKKEFSQEKRNALNALSDEVKGICKLASLKITNNPALKDSFNFKKVTSQMANIRKAKAANKDVEATSENENQANIIS